MVEPDRVEDERGYFARTFVDEQFAARGLDPRIAQTAVSYNKRKGTLRGMHWQAAPYGQAKLVRCTRGAIYDAVIDLRAESPAGRNWVGVELRGSDGRMLYVPGDFAHGFLTLEDDTEVLYHLSTALHAPAERGVPWDDPAFGIEWPFAPTVLSDRDRSFAPIGRAAR